MRDVIQAIGRIRKLVSTTIEFAMYDRPFIHDKYLPDTISGVRKQLEMEALQVVTAANNALISITTLEDTHPAIVSTMIYNRLETNASRLYSRQVLEWYLEEAGYELQDADIEEIEDEDEVSVVLPESSRMLYKDIPRLEEEDIEMLEEKNKRNLTNSVEKCQYDMYCCMALLQDDAPEELKARVYDELWNTSRHVLHNLREEKRGLVAAKIRFEKKVAYKSALLVSGVDKVYVKLIAMTDICDRLHISNTGTRCIISREVVERLVMPNGLLDIMELKTSRGNEQEIQGKVKTLKRVFEAFTSATFRTYKNKILRDGKRVTVSCYVLEPLMSELWNILRP